LEKEKTMSKVLEKIAKAVTQGDEDEIAGLTQDALGEGLGAKEILQGGLMPGMDHVGVEFKAGRMFVPEVLLSARTMKGSMAVLEPLLAAGESIAVGKAIMGTVEGDLHDIGKNLVITLLEGAGYRVIDLGIDVPKEKFLQVVQEAKPSILGMSAMLTTTMMAMKDVVDLLRERGMRQNIKVIVGGAPLNSSFARQIGADGYAEDAVVGVELVKSFTR
jgi:5-methyltetrahydrofolate--homocysteine methyltransferase